jgi:hypothetical protein
MRGEVDTIFYTMLTAPTDLRAVMNDESSENERFTYRNKSVKVMEVV